MKEMSPEAIKREIVDSFEFILELDRKPELLKRLPRKSLLVGGGKKRMLISTAKEPRVIML